MADTARSFSRQAQAITVETAKLATTVSRQTYSSWLSGRPLAPPRTKRKTTSGNFENLIKWYPGASGAVYFDWETLDGQAWYWKIQEIGTGQSATILGPEGGAIVVKSQIGREIKPGLYWGNAGGIPATYGGLQQLYPYTMVPEGLHVYGYSDPSNMATIHKEIHGKHFVQKGGTAGFTHLREELQVAFERAFL